MRQKLIPIILLSVGLFGCNKASTVPAEVAAGPTATVTLKDGGSFTGVVTASSPTDMTLKSASGEARSYPLDQVLSVKYADSLPPAPAAAPVAASNKMAPEPRMSSPAPKTTTSNSPAPQTGYRPSQPSPQRPVEEFSTIPAGTSIQVRNNEPISSQSAEPGQTFTAVISQDVLDTSGKVAIPSGSDATLVVVSVDDQGKIQGRSNLAVDLGGVTVAGRHYRLDTSDYAMRGKDGVGTNKRTGVFTGGGAALGGIIGAIAGGGKGAAIGAASGAGAGMATQSLTRGKAVRIPAETIMTFKLEAPVRIREAR
ncbi:MAG: hypothetical protein JWN34_1718 [Bryobacterales bacterium]|nr:hypothetical protein [Bryobacterales bacterium]